MTFPRFTLRDDGSVSFDDGPELRRVSRAELTSDGPVAAWLRSAHGDSALVAMRALLGVGPPADMRGQSYSPWRLVMQDLAWSVLRVLAPERSPGHLTTRSTTEQVTIERGITAPVDRSAATWSDGDARLSVELDESWWNEHTLANSFLRATVGVGARQVSLFFDDDGSLRWTGTNLTGPDLTVVGTMLGPPFVRAAQSKKPT